MLTLAIVGFGAIGQALARVLQADAQVRIAQIVVSARSLDAARQAAAQLAPEARVVPGLDIDGSARPQCLVECASHSALAAHVVPALRAGVPCVVASIGALADARQLAQLEDAARAGGARVRLVSGAIGGIDALAAARVGGLDRVTYTGRKPPKSWAGTLAETQCDLAALTEPRTIFRGTAREAASQYPKNANVAATVALAGVGMDDTQVELVADPGVERNVHVLEASGAFGHLHLRLENYALASNPKTSALTVYSLARAVRDAVGPLGF